MPWRSDEKLSSNLQYLQKNMGVEVIAVPVSTRSDGRCSDLSIEIRPALPNRFHHLLTGITVAQKVREILKEKSVDAVISWEHEAAFFSDWIQSEDVVFGMIAAHPSYQLQVDNEQAILPLKKISNAWFRWRPLRSADV